MECILITQREIFTAPRLRSNRYIWVFKLLSWKQVEEPVTLPAGDLDREEESIRAQGGTEAPHKVLGPPESAQKMRSHPTVITDLAGLRRR